MANRRMCGALVLVFLIVTSGWVGGLPSAAGQDEGRRTPPSRDAVPTQEAAAQEASSATPADDDADAEHDRQPRNRFDDFLRIRVDEEDEPVSMDTSVTRYTKMDKEGREIQVDLIGAVHIGEREYYEALNKHFEQYDVLLYELVAPEGTRIPRGGLREEGFNPLSGMQSMMGRVLELDFQLEHIDYTKNNFVHADISMEEFAENMSKNDESLVKLFFRVLGHSMAAAQSGNGPSDLELIRAYLSDDRAMRMRRLMAGQMRDIETVLSLFEGEDGSTIVHHRNEAALEIMKREIAKGHRRIGIFYGCGHLPDMEDHLLNNHGMELKERSWYVAWRMRDEEIEYGPMPDESVNADARAGNDSAEDKDPEDKDPEDKDPEDKDPEDKDADDKDDSDDTDANASNAEDKVAA